MMGGILKFTITYPALGVVRMLIYDLTIDEGLNFDMTAYINVFTRGIGYSHWKIDLGFILLPKYEIKRMLAKTMSIWFIKGKNVYARKTGRYAEEKDKDSWIVHISLV